MSSSALAAGLLHLRVQLAARQRSAESDEQLLHAFTSRRDDNAFAVLVHRHGPMVLHVCRRVLGHEQDAEDAFQATFLVLARNAAALRSKTSLASFLHGTAYRTAMKAKQFALRRRKHESRALPLPPVDPADELSWREVRALLDEEIARLPEIYRSVFVLCHLEDLSRAEAAQRLGLKECTLLSRLTKARKRLAQRLARRGVELTAVLAASTLAAQSASALPAGLMASTVKAALATAAGEKLAGIVSASVIELVKSMTTAMMVGKVKIATVMLLAASMMAGASAWAYRGLAANALMPSALPAEPPAAKAEDKPKAASPQREAAKTVEIQGRVFDPDGKPKAGVKLLLLSGDKPKPLGATAADGRFRIAIPKETKERWLIAKADGFGIDFLDLPKGEPKKPVEFRLVKDRPIHGRITNTEGKPVPGVRVAVDNLVVYPNNSLDSFLAIWKKQQNVMSGLPNGEKQIWKGAGALLAARTDAKGCFTISHVGDERVVSFRLSGGGIADAEAWVVNRHGFDPKPYNEAVLNNSEPRAIKDFGNHWHLYGPGMSFVAEAGKPIRGIVKDADSGKGCPGVRVLLTRQNSSELVGTIPEAITDAQGRYEIRGAHKAKRYMLEAAAVTAAGYVPGLVWTDDTAGYDPVTVDIQLKKGVIVTGKVIDQATGKSVPGWAVADVLSGNSFVKEYPFFSHPESLVRDNSRERTAEDGTFRVVTIPGPVLLMGAAIVETPYQFMRRTSDPKYPQFFSKDSKFGEYYSTGGFPRLIQGTFCKVLEIKPDAKIVEQDIVVERASALPIRIQDVDGKPLPGIWFAGYGPQGLRRDPAIQCEKAECEAYQLGPGKPRLLVFFHAERKLAGTLTLKGDEKTPAVAKLGPAGAIKGRLLDAEGKPLAGVIVDVQYRQRAASAVHKVVHRAKQIVTDAEGAFTLDDLIPGQKWELSFRRGKRKFERTPKPVRPAIEVKPGECRDLGAIKLKLVP